MVHKRMCYCGFLSIQAMRTPSALTVASAASSSTMLAAARASRYSSDRSVRALLMRCARSSVATACSSRAVLSNM